MRGGQSPGPAPGSPRAPLRICDPRKLRALAHPARIAILQFLVFDGPATATECAEVTGLSPSACSYHLRALARHGFVAADPASAADGRQRPWRAQFVSLSYGDEPGQPEAARQAGRLLTESFQAYLQQYRARYLDRETEFDRGWRAAAGLTQDVLHVTAEELARVRAQVSEMLAPYRRLGKDGRPPGAERVLVIFDLVPAFDPGQPGPGQRGAGRPGQEQPGTGQPGTASRARTQPGAGQIR